MNQLNFFSVAIYKNYFNSTSFVKLSICNISYFFLQLKQKLEFLSDFNNFIFLISLYNRNYINVSKIGLSKKCKQCNVHFQNDSWLNFFNSLKIITTVKNVSKSKFIQLKFDKNCDFFRSWNKKNVILKLKYLTKILNWHNFLK